MSGLSDMIQRFARSLNYRDLPGDWAKMPEVIQTAAQMKADLGTDSPFFKAWWNNSQAPLRTWYNGSETPISVYDPVYSTTKNISGFFTSNPDIANYYSLRRLPIQINDKQQFSLLKDRIQQAIDKNYPIFSAFSANNPVSYLNNGKQIAELPVLEEWQIAQKLHKEAPRWYPDYDPEISPEFFAISGENPLDYIENTIPNKWKDLYFYGNYGISNPSTADDILTGLASDLKDIHLQHKPYEKYLQSFLDANNAVIPSRDINASDLFTMPKTNVNEVFLKADNPVYLDNKNKDWYNIGNVARELDKKYNPTKSYDPNNNLPPTDYYGGLLFERSPHDALFVDNIIDGGVVPSNIAMIKNPTQIKALDNVGTYNPNDPNIYRSIIAGIAANDRPLEDAWNPLESIAAAPVGALSAGGAGASILLDALLAALPVEQIFNSRDYSPRPIYFGE